MRLPNGERIDTEFAWRVPLLHSVTTGVLAALPVVGVGSMAYLYEPEALASTAAATLAAAFTASSVASVVTWLRFQQRVIWVYEMLSGIDVDGDGVVGNPSPPTPAPVPPSRPMPRAVSVKDNGRERLVTMNTSVTANADAEFRVVMRGFIGAIRDLGTTAQNKVEAHPYFHTFAGVGGRKTYIHLRDWLIAHKYAEWRGASRRAGWHITSEDDVLRQIVGHIPFYKEK